MSFYDFARRLCLVFVSLIFKIKISGLNDLEKETGGFVLISNHQSNFDPVFLGLHLNRRLFFMAKSELFSIPIFGFIVKKLGAFPVKRGLHDLKSIEIAENIVKSGRVLAMFPEGTRSKTGDVLKFKIGAVKIALAANCKIVPCSIFYGKKRFRREVFVEYGKSIDLVDLISSNNLQVNEFNDLDKASLKWLNEQVRSCVVKMNMQQKSRQN